MKHMKVSWDDEIPKIWKITKVPNHQPDIDIYIYITRICIGSSKTSDFHHYRIGLLLLYIDKVTESNPMGMNDIQQ